MLSQAHAPFEIATYEKKWVDGLNRGDVSLADQVFQPDCVIHINGNPDRNLNVENFKLMVTGLLAAFPDLHFTIDDQLIAGEKVGTRWTATGTNTGPFGEMQPTGKAVKIDGLIIDHLIDGKVAERWELWDQMSMMQQLGIM